MARKKLGGEKKHYGGGGDPGNTRNRKGGVGVVFPEILGSPFLPKGTIGGVGVQKPVKTAVGGGQGPGKDGVMSKQPSDHEKGLCCTRKVKKGGGVWEKTKSLNWGTTRSFPRFRTH